MTVDPTATAPSTADLDLEQFKQAVAEFESVVSDYWHAHGTSLRVTTSDIAAARQALLDSYTLRGGTIGAAAQPAGDTAVELATDGVQPRAAADSSVPGEAEAERLAAEIEQLLPRLRDIGNPNRAEHWSAFCQGVGALSRAAALLRSAPLAGPDDGKAVEGRVLKQNPYGQTVIVTNNCQLRWPEHARVRVRVSLIEEGGKQ